MPSKDKAFEYSCYVLLGVLAYFPIFLHLDHLPFSLWDESRLAINAYEMMKGDSWLVTTFLNEPDLWNTKPPLLIWIQALFMKIFGVNELAVRLPSAIAALLTAFTLFIIAKKYLQNFWFGFAAVIILVTSAGYISIHGTRSGDYDALLTLFTTTYCLSFFLYAEKTQTKFLYAGFVALILAVLTKSVSGLFFGPAILLYFLWKKQLIPLFKNKHFYINLGILVTFILGYYLLREAAHPGYLKAIWNNELGSRFMNTIEHHHGSFLFYHNAFKGGQLPYWYWLLPVGMGIGLLNKDQNIFRLSLFSTLCFLSYFLLVSAAQTKLRWYDMPMYPFIALLISNFIWFGQKVLTNIPAIQKELKVNIVPYAFLFLIFSTPYTSAFHRSYFPKKKPTLKAEYAIFHFLKKVATTPGDEQLKEFYLPHNHEHRGMQTSEQYDYLYTYILVDQGKLKGQKHVDDLVAGDQVIIHRDKYQSYIESKFTFDILEEQEYFRLVRLNELKTN